MIAAIIIAWKQGAVENLVHGLQHLQWIVWVLGDIYSNHSNNNINFGGQYQLCAYSIYYFSLPWKASAVLTTCWSAPQSSSSPCHKLALQVHAVLLPSCSYHSVLAFIILRFFVVNLLQQTFATTFKYLTLSRLTVLSEWKRTFLPWWQGFVLSFFLILPKEHPE